MTEDVKILRKAAYEYAKAIDPVKNEQKLELHKACNDLKQVRPVVLIDELPWSEMNIDGELTLKCEDEYLREVEWYLKSNLFKYRHMPADMVLSPFVPVGRTIRSSGIGIKVEEDTLAYDKTNKIVSHNYKDILRNEDDLERIKDPVISYDKEDTIRRFGLVGEILGDILPVRLTGVNVFYCSPWDDISRYHGVTNLLIDLAERPEFMHKAVSRLSGISRSVLEQYEALGVLSCNPYGTLHCTPVNTGSLPQEGSDPSSLKKSDIWGRGYAQIFGSVSKQMHDEFDIEYMKDTIGHCGLVYYGCCEPLDKKIDIVERIPNLRKISVTPWADVNIAAEAIGSRYVLSSKPNPAAVAVPVLDKDSLRKELGTILNACRRNNCSCDIVLKDISTCCKRPQNIFEWEKTAMEMVSL